MFDRGTTVLIGPNGAGKSSVIDGVMFALFGRNERGRKLEDLIRRGARDMDVELDIEINGHDYRVKRGRNKSNGYATVYSLEDMRPLAGGDNAIETVNRYLEELLAMDRNVLINTVILKQGEIEGIISEKPAERKAIINHLLGIDDMERVYTLLRDVRDDISSIVNRADIEQSETATELKNLTERLSENDDLLNVKRKSAEKIRSDMDRIRKELENLEKNLETFKDKEVQYTALTEKINVIQAESKSMLDVKATYEKELNTFEGRYGPVEHARKVAETLPLLERAVVIQGEMKEIKNKLEKLRESADILKTISSDKHTNAHNFTVNDRPEDLFATHRSLKDQINHLAKMLEGDEKHLGALLEKISQHIPQGQTQNSVLNQLDNEYKDLDNERKDLNKKIGDAEGEISRIDTWLQSMVDVNRCPLCGRVFDAEHSSDDVVLRLNKRKGVLEKAIAEHRTRIRVIERAMGDVSNKRRALLNLPISEADSLRRRITDHKKNIEKYRMDLDRVSKKAGALLANIEHELDILKEEHDTRALKLKDIKRDVGRIPPDLERKMSEIRNVRDALSRIESEKVLYDKAVSKMKQITDELHTLKEKLSLLEYSREVHESLKTKHANHKATLNSLEERLRDISLEIKTLDKRRDEFSIRIKNVRSRINELREKNEVYRKMLAGVNTIRSGFGKDGIPRILRSEAIPAIQRFTEQYASLFNFGITAITINENFDMGIFRGNNEYSMAMLSGGQRTALAISMRLAIARFLGKNLSMIIMDEPTANLDEERRYELVNLIKDFMSSPDNLAQLIVVTHHRELETIADTLYRVNLINGESVIREETL